MLFKATSEIPLFLIKKVLEQTAAFDYYWYGYFQHEQQMRPSKKGLYHVVTFVAKSLVSFFNLPFSKYVLKVLATFLVSSKAR